MMQHLLPLEAGKAGKKGTKLSINPPPVCTHSPRVLRVPGHDLANVHTLREIADAHAIAAAGEGKDVVLVGSSFIGTLVPSPLLSLSLLIPSFAGMEVAAFFAGKAKSLTVVGMERVPFERVLGHEVGGAYQALHSSKGNLPSFLISLH